MKDVRKLVLAVCFSFGLFIPIFAGSGPGLAQDAEDLSCSELWYKRNEIYARNGYCFKTARAKAVFGRGCFPPFGSMSGWEKQRVNELQYWEARKGC
jgi:hypothetical protein